ncbi:MAG: nicotinate phosphoribosyltransferase [Candidatus Methanomethylophilaceae archaeon]|nr:nicotinate phosphoribosyltransferase [Candidatus Methanomethylophilaceae archaeon]
MADADDIRSGRTMDVYFRRAKQVLESQSLQDVVVKGEFTASSLPEGWPWAVLCGTEEVLRLLEGLPVDLYGIPEGTVFQPRAANGARVPVMGIQGRYVDFGELETSILGMLCHPSGVATRSARCKAAAEGKPLLSFGNRRMHPAISPMLDRSSYIGGCDDVASPQGAELIGKEPVGTVPHALMLLMGSDEAALRAFDALMPSSVPRIMLVDTYDDERSGALKACRTLPNLQGIRLDTPRSRRGSFRQIVQELRWEMDMQGHEKVRIIASGGLDEQQIRELSGSGVDSFAVGTSISNAPTLDFSLDLVEVDGEPMSKRGKFSGRKYPYRCPQCYQWQVSLHSDDSIVCGCGSQMEMMEVPLLKGGRRCNEPRSAKEIRDSVLRQIEDVNNI